MQTGNATVTLSTPAAATTTFTAPTGLTADVGLRFTLRVTDAGGLSAADTVAVTVVVKDAQTGPEIVGPTSFTVVEGETAVGTLMATDADTPAADLVWSPAGGADSGHFTLDERGVLRFAVPKDYEAPDDAGRDGTYELKRFSNRPCTTWGGRGTSARTDAGGPMRAYSMDLRERALLDSDAGMTAADVAAKYRVSGSWVRLLKQRRRETGEVAPRVQRQGRRGMLEPHLHTLADLIAAHPDRTLAERKDALATPASVPTVWRAVRALGLTVKQHGPPVRTRSA